MRKIIRGTLLCLVLLLCLLLLLNLTVTTKQGVNYELRTIKLPLYLKLLDFFDRHYNYTHLVKNITENSKSDKDRAIALLGWTHNNIKKRPQELVVVDDHVWHTIVRGYGVEDQFSDVFSTLCNYAGIEAFYSWVNSSELSSRMTFSFVKIENKWYVFDPYRDIYFVDKEGELADINMLKSSEGGWMPSGAGAFLETLNYASYFKNMSLPGDSRLSRANIQSPLNRFFYAIKKMVPAK